MTTTSVVDSPAWQQTHHAQGMPFGNLEPSQAKEQFSLAYLHSIATAARCTLSDPRVDDERVDVTIRQKASHRQYSHSEIDVQLKCSSQNILHPDGIHFDLPKTHFEDLADLHRMVSVILVVMHVPEDPNEWVSYPGGDHSKGLLLKHAAYWTYLGGQVTANKSSRTVIIPPENKFDVPGLLGILKRVGDGGTP